MINQLKNLMGFRANLTCKAYNDQYDDVLEKVISPRERDYLRVHFRFSKIQKHYQWRL